MSMFEQGHAGPGITGAKTTSWEHYNPRDIILRLFREFPNADDKVIARHLRDAVLGDEPEYLLPCLLYVVRLTRRALDDEERAIKKREERQRTREQQPDERLQERVVQAKANVTEHVRAEAEKILLDLEMPNGKPLRDCTGDDCRHFGGWYQRLAERVEADKLVGNVLSEQQVQELYQAG